MGTATPMCEGEFDCMISDQAIGVAFSVATLGGVAKQWDLFKTGPYLMTVQIVLVAYDRDSAGQNDPSNMVALGNTLREIHLPEGPWKEINEFFPVGNDTWPLVKPLIRVMEAIRELHSL